MAISQEEIQTLQAHNYLLEEIALNNYTMYEIKVLAALGRQTVGWSQHEDQISRSQITELTGMSSSNISKAIRGLKKKGKLSSRTTGRGKGQRAFYTLLGTKQFPLKNRKLRKLIGVPTDTISTSIGVPTDTHYNKDNKRNNNNKSSYNILGKKMTKQANGYFTDESILKYFGLGKYAQANSYY